MQPRLRSPIAARNLVGTGSLHQPDGHGHPPTGSFGCIASASFTSREPFFRPPRFLWPGSKLPERCNASRARGAPPTKRVDVYAKARRPRCQPPMRACHRTLLTRHGSEAAPSHSADDFVGEHRTNASRLAPAKLVGELGLERNSSLRPTCRASNPRAPHNGRG